MTTTEQDQPDWSEIRRREIGTGLGHGLDLAAATDAADDVIKLKQELAGRVFTVSRTVRDAEIIPDTDGFLSRVEPAIWQTEPGIFPADDTGGVSGWVDRSES